MYTEEISVAGSGPAKYARQYAHLLQRIDPSCRDLIAIMHDTDTFTVRQSLTIKYLNSVQSDLQAWRTLIQSGALTEISVTCLDEAESIFISLLDEIRQLRTMSQVARHQQ